MKPLRLLAIDPGIDLVAAAVFDSRACPAQIASDPYGFTRAAHGLVQTWTCKTEPGEASVLRCRRIRMALEAEFAGDPFDIAIVEIPVYAGRNRKAMAAGRRMEAMAEGMALLNRSIGAITAGLRAKQLVEMRAFGNRKEDRRTVLNRILAGIGKPEIRNLDLSDAAYIGLVWMQEYLRDHRVFERNVHAGELHPTWAAAEMARRSELEAKPRRKRLKVRGGR